MFKALSSLFTSKKPDTNTPMKPELAVAALLIHLIGIDGETTSAEQEVAKQVLQKHFSLDESQVIQLLDDAREKDRDAVDFYQFTSLITRLEMDQRINIIAMMWETVFADGKNHELEDNMVWRVAELIGVSSRDRTILRKKISQQSDLRANRE